MIRPLIIAERVCKVLARVFEGCAEFGQGRKIIVSRLCTLENGTEIMRQPEKYEKYLRVEKSFGQGQD